MKTNNTILIVEDNIAHFELIRKNLLRAGISNEMKHFTDGQETLKFLFDTSKNSGNSSNVQGYIILLDIGMPGGDGVEILEKIKARGELKKIPVIILTEIDDTNTIQRCHDLGCSTYVVKPTQYELFADTVQTIGHFLSVIELASI